MTERFYAKEPFDMKLFLLCFFKKIPVLVIAMVFGAFLVSGAHYLSKTVFGGPVQYEITTTYFIEYNCVDEETGSLTNYTNGTTWQSWVDTDWFVDRAWEHALQLGMVAEEFGVQKSDLPGFFAADVASDARIPHSIVTTPHKELTPILNEALQLTFMDFGINQREMDEIRITDETPLAESNRDIRMVRACILGTLMGAFVAGFFISFGIIWDDSIRIPETFVYRYQIPMVGYWGSGKKEPMKEVLTNIRYLFGEKDNSILLSSLQIAGEKDFTEKWKEYGFETLVYGELEEENYQTLRNAKGVLLLIEAGITGGKEIEHILQQLKLQQVSVNAAILYHADDKLIQAYYFGRKTKNREQ